MKWLFERIKGLFSKEKEAGLLPPAQECDYIKEQSSEAIKDCDLSQRWTKPLSVEELKKQNARARIKSRENVQERYFEEEPGWEIGK